MCFALSDNEVVDEACFANIHGYCHEGFAADGVHALNVFKIHHFHIVDACQWLGSEVRLDDFNHLFCVFFAIFDRFLSQFLTLG